MMQVEKIRQEFPELGEQVYGKPLVYLDNAATSQRPRSVIRKWTEMSERRNANLHRAVHRIADLATTEYEATRDAVREYLNAAHREEIIFTSGATAAINLVARSMSFGLLEAGDEIITTEMEHHANLIPWQEACRRTGAVLHVVPVTKEGELDYGKLEALISRRTKLVAVTAVSNVTGTVNELDRIIRLAHDAGAWVLVDGSQAVRHGMLDMSAMDCDFFCFSGHKMMGPTGTGVLYGKREVLEQLPPETFGGGMVDQVFTDHATYGDLPFRLEAGTPNIMGIIGLGAAVKYLTDLGRDEIVNTEDRLLSLAEKELRARPQIDILGSPVKRAGCISFNIKGCHCYDTAKLLDQLGVAMRSGHHCAEPLLTAFGETGAVRLSPAFYNTEDEILEAMKALDRVIRLIERTVRK